MFQILSIDVSETQRLSYEFLSVLKFAHITKDLANQIIRNLVFLLRVMIEHQGVEKATEVAKTFKKASFIGKKLMGDKSDSTATALEALLNFYSVAISLFKE